MVSCIPQISIIVPVYNVEKYLRRCIDSILAQTFTDFELLLIDDGSTDGSGKICDEYNKKDKRIRVFHKKNGGVSSARNVGLDNAQGDWICFCDADDWVKSEFLSTFHSMMKEGDLLSQGFHSSNWFNCDNKDIFENTGLYQNDKYLPFILELYKNNHLGFIWCKSFKNEIISKKQIRFDKNIHFAEDLIFVLRYCNCINSIKNVSACLYQYKFTEQGKTFGKQNDFYVWKQIYLLFNKLDRNNLHTIEIKSLAISNIFFYLCIGKIRDKNLKNDVKFFLDEFGDYLYLSNGTYKRLELFRKFLIWQNVRYACFLVKLIRFYIKIKS